MRYFIYAIVAFLVSGCATGEYIQYAKSQENVEIARSNAEAARFRALSDIAQNGDSSSKVAAVMALALGGNSISNAQANNMAAPERNQALQWASILVPGLTQIYGIRSNASVANKASDNAAATSIATTNGFVNMGNRAQGLNTNTTTSNSYTISGNSGANSGNSTAQPTVVQQPTPVSNTYTYTVSGNSGSGSGTTTTSGNSGANSGNSTSTPTVVQQPTPIVVQQAPPVVVKP